MAKFWFGSGDVRLAIIKDLEQKELANEVMTTALAGLGGLPVPRGHIVRAPPGVLAVSKGPLLSDGSRLCFASEDVGVPCVAQLYIASDPTVTIRIRRRLADLSAVGSLYGFDSWVANVDRHERNLLMGGTREIYLIDHGHCFTGRTWSVTGLKADSVYVNKLKNWLTPAMTDKQRSSRANEAALVPGSYTGVDLHALAVANHVDALLSSADLNALVKFLEDRKVHVARLAADALNMVV